MKFLLRHLELIFTAAGIAMIFGVTAIFTPVGMSLWQVAAVTATLVGIVHGALFLLLRRRQRAARHSTIGEIQRMF